MKPIFLLLSASSLIYGQTAELPPEIASLPSQPLLHQEVQPFDPSITIQQPLQLDLPAPVFQPSPKSAFAAVGLSVLVPGLGHVYLGDTRTATGLLGSTLAGGSLEAIPAVRENVPLAGLTTVQATWSYGLFAAYRDVRNYNRQTGYRYRMPQDSFQSLAAAPFNFHVMKKPEVWGGLLGAFALAAGITHFVFPKEARIHATKLSTRMDISPICAFPVGLGEECLFRGALQSSLMEGFSPWGAIAISSLAFGAAHIPNAQALEPADQWRYYAFSVPFITAFGAYFGWMTHKNCSLQESVALHSWYDFVLFAAGAVASEAAITGRTGFSFAVPF